MFTRRDFFGVVAAPLFRNITPPAIAAGVSIAPIPKTFAGLVATSASANWANRVGKPLSMESLSEALEALHRFDSLAFAPPNRFVTLHAGNTIYFRKGH